MPGGCIVRPTPSTIRFSMWLKFSVAVCTWHEPGVCGVYKSISGESGDMNFEALHANRPLSLKHCFWMEVRVRSAVKTIIENCVVRIVGKFYLLSWFPAV